MHESCVLHTTGPLLHTMLHAHMSILLHPTGEETSTLSHPQLQQTCSARPSVYTVPIHTRLESSAALPSTYLLPTSHSLALLQGHRPHPQPVLRQPSAQRHSATRPDADGLPPLAVAVSPACSNKDKVRKGQAPDILQLKKYIDIWHRTCSVCWESAASLLGARGRSGPRTHGCQCMHVCVLQSCSISRSMPNATSTTST